MNIIKPNFEILEQLYGDTYDDLIDHMYKHIELCGRTCYNSIDHITPDSYTKFVANLIKSGHGAMLEHGTIYLSIPIGTPFDDDDYMLKTDVVKFFKQNPYSKVNCEKVNDMVNLNIHGLITNSPISIDMYYITTNFRVVIENGDNIMTDNELYNHEKFDLTDIITRFVTKPTEKHALRHTVKFMCDIGVTREFNRHRHNSIAEQSTRYCNYTKSKFQEGEGGLNICLPIFVNEKSLNGIDYKEKFISICKMIGDEVNLNLNPVDYWIFANYACSFAYENLIKSGWKPQEARTILPLDTKSVLVHTAFDTDWLNFFRLRAIGITGQPHPSAKELALPLMEEFIRRGYIDTNMVK